MKPLFSICLIVKNEASTLPRLRASLEEYVSRVGEIVILDTGSTDGTPELAAVTLGCHVIEAEDQFLLDVQHVDGINKRFIVKGEEPVIKHGDKYFDFSSARNEVIKYASNDIVFFYDADEVATVLDIDAINEAIQEGYTQFEYNFVFSHDVYGNEAVKFIQCKAFDRRVMHWTGIVHELVTPLQDQTPKVKFLPENVYKLSHYQNQETGRHSYLIGLAVDCYANPNADRQSHYFARELMWSGRFKSAIAEFTRHINMNGWQAERAQSCIHIGDCCGALNDPDNQILWYNKAFYIDSNRREPLIKIARFYLHNKNYTGAIAYAKAALEIPYNGFYANNLSHYTYEPHEILYIAYGWIGKIKEAQEHLLICLDYQELNPNYLRDTRYYFEYPDNGLPGWMFYQELVWLYNLAKKYDTIVEVGSWKGRSTHALCTGSKGKIIAVDTWEGSDDLRDDTNRLAKQEDVFHQFKENTKQFDNLEIRRGRSIDVAKTFEDKSVDVVFIDAGHDYESVKEDIEAWLPKAKYILCGHDYVTSWMGVIKAVDEKFGRVDELCKSIWSIDLTKRNDS